MKSRLYDKAKERLKPPATELHANPLVTFPSKGGCVSGVFFSNEMRKNVQSASDKSRWLDPERLDPNFGVKGSLPGDNYKKEYRRLASRDLFTVPRPDSISLNELRSSSSGKGINTANTQKRYVLVEEDRLSKLIQLEKVLSAEEQRIGEQCTLMLPDIEYSARIPVPAVRLALHDLCESEMRTLAAKITQLMEKWNKHCKENDYLRFRQREYRLDTAPTNIQRVIKMKLLKESESSQKHRYERDSMLFEDDLSFIANKYHDVKDRRLDYDRYFIMAVRYGPMTDAEFNIDGCPGKRYWRRAVRAALMIQHLWDRYWALRRVRIFRRAIMIQKNWRCHVAYKANHGIIALRAKYGFKSLYRYYWFKWMQYNQLSVLCKRIAKYISGPNLRGMLRIWRKWAQEQVERRANILRKFMGAATNKWVFMTFGCWKSNTKARISARKSLIRMAKNPYFDVWLNYVKWRKHVKFLHGNAVQIQRIARGVAGRATAQRRRDAAVMLYQFALIIFAKTKVWEMRENFTEIEFVDWLPSDIEKKQFQANDNERRRMARLQQSCADKEKAAVKDLRTHFRSKDGQLQLQAMGKVLFSSGELIQHHKLGQIKPTSLSHAQELAEYQLLMKCGAFARNVEKHNFVGKAPPFIRCVDFACGVICTNEEQYINHLECTPCHVAARSPPFPQFHLILRHPKGQDLVRQYATRTMGMGLVVNCLDCWSSIQEWYRVTALTEQYGKKLVSLYEIFLRKDAPRSVSRVLGACDKELEEFREKMEVFKNREDNGFFVDKLSEPGFFRRTFGFKGKPYKSWTLDNQIQIDDFIPPIEWYLFKHVYDAIYAEEIKSSNPNAFMNNSQEYKQYQHVILIDAVNRKVAQKNEYMLYRKGNFSMWALEFKNRETAMKNKAEEVIRILETLEIERLTKLAMRVGAKEVVHEMVYEQQSKHEWLQCIMDESLFSAEEDCLEEVYQFYVSAMLKTMWAIPECRKGMLEYAGLLTGKTRKNFLQDISNHYDSGQWFNNFFNNTVQDEKKMLPLDKEAATIRIQAYVRGMQGRKIGRKKLTSTIFKKFDKESNSCYYINVKTGESTWVKPKLFSKLFPKTNW